MYNNCATFCDKTLKIEKVINCRIFGIENHNFLCGVRKTAT